ncbi:CROL alpha [Colletotrichum truncatum]|uniref:CROL alpha n=1 Tax=Colletotrichum truncatum TaxID=5467 RepID=A0ACC3Z9C0_COLTU|nr:CROL alpha [Colletotrichum truncatum]KAF6793562.1 CROL alpha [Colletotrichum truncatum]
MPIGKSDYNSYALSDSPASSLPQTLPPSTNTAASYRQSKCAECGEQVIYGFALEWHARGFRHKAYRCKVTGCDERFVTIGERDAHHRRPHLQNHGRVETEHPFACVECMESFPYKAGLERHANEAQHSPFACVCGKKFARLDVLNRHLDSLGNDMPKYPCQFCKRHRGNNGFRRRDHLLQHIRGYHKFEAEEKIGDILPSRRGKYQVPPVCPHPRCSSHQDESFKHMSEEEQNRNKPFNTQAEYTKHMKTVHDFTPYPCTVAGCNKTGAKGYAREKDLINHRNKEHPDAAAYVPGPRDVRIECRWPGCDARLYSNSMMDHEANHKFRAYRLNLEESKTADNLA